MNRYDVIIAGGGASGMAAAIAAAGHGAKTAIIEAQPRIGRKLLSTGNGRCNITNKNVSVTNYRTNDPEKLSVLLNRTDTKTVERFFDGIGIPIFEERGGRMYPRSETAAGVLDMLRFELERLNVRIITDKRVSGIYKKNGAWIVEAGEEHASFSAGSLIIACGSPANPQLGGCDDSVSLAAKLNIRTEPRQPSLCPLLCTSPVLRSLKGVRVHCQVTLVQQGSILGSENGELQFNENNLSGICVFQLSNRLTRLSFNETYIITDYVPYMNNEHLHDMLCRRRDRFQTLAAEDFLSGVLNKRLSIAVLKTAGISPMTKPAGILTDRELYLIEKNMKEMKFKISGLSAWRQAQTAAGGIPLSDLSEQLEVMGKSGLFACGESVACTGDCGGFNLHWAWVSGLTAGTAAAEYKNIQT